MGKIKVWLYESTWHHVIVLGWNPPIDDKLLSHLFCVMLYLSKVASMFIGNCKEISDQILAELCPLGLHKPMHCGKTMALQCRKMQGKQGCVLTNTPVWQQGEVEALCLKQSWMDTRFHQVNKAKLSQAIMRGTDMYSQCGETFLNVYFLMFLSSYTYKKFLQSCHCTGSATMHLKEDF